MPTATRNTGELLGDPESLALYQFRLAQELCAECRDYHALWPYRRLSRTVSGIEATADIVEAQLRDVTPPNARVLIAGVADAGMLALTARSVKHRTSFIDVADRCPTPLAVCQHYATVRGLSITTFELDFAQSQLPQPYDVVFGDSIMQFVPPRSHVDVLRKLGQAMAHGSALIIVERRRSGGEDEARRRRRLAETLDRLAAHGIELPEDKASFLLRLDKVLDGQRTRITDYVSDLPRCLGEAGFRLKELSDAEGQRIVSFPSGGSVTIKIAVAFPIKH